MSKFSAATALSFAALAAAQTLSSACTSGITGLQTNNAEANKCLALNQFTNIFLTPSGTSVINPVNNWLVSMCGAADCSDAALTAVVDTVTESCASDITSLAGSAVDADTVLPYVLQYFLTAKQIVCLADKTTDTFCETQLARKAETALGTPLSIANLFSIATGVLSSGESPVNASLACTDCTKGAISILRKDTQIASIVDVNDIAADTCGADFAASATTLPASVAIGTGAAVPKGTGSTDGKDGAATLAVAGTLSALAGALVVAFLA